MAIIGIDLGTTNSLVCVWKDGKSIVIPNSLGDVLTPSVIGVDENEEILIGKIAREYQLVHPECTASSFKRFMGTDKLYKLRSKEFTATDLSSIILKRLKEDAELFLGEEVKEAIISVPAYFNDFQRNATKIAGKLAGLHVERLINEPSAAVLAYYYEHPEEKTLLAFDFGGGTLDVSVVDIFDNVIEIVAVSGDNYLGGDDIDQTIAQRFIEEKEINTSCISKEEYASIMKAAKRAKEQLTTIPNAVMEVRIDGSIFEMEMDSKALLEIMNPIFGKISKPLERVLSDSGYLWEDIDDIILIGGSSKMPLIQNYLQLITGKKPLAMIDPDKAVAAGVGMYAGIKERNEDIRDLVLTDICPFTLGTAVVQNNIHAPTVMSPIIERNSTLPISRVERYQTATPHQKNCLFTILQGEQRIASENITLGKIEMKVPKGSNLYEEFDVRFTYDINGILEIDITVVSTGETLNQVIINKGIHMSDEEIENRRNELQKLKIHPRDYEKNRLLLEKGARLFTENIGDVRTQIENILEYFEDALNSQDKKKIKRAFIHTTELFKIIDTAPKHLIMFYINEYLRTQYVDDDTEE